MNNIIIILLGGLMGLLFNVVWNSIMKKNQRKNRPIPKDFVNMKNAVFNNIDALERKVSDTNLKISNQSQYWNIEDSKRLKLLNEIKDNLVRLSEREAHNITDVKAKKIIDELIPSELKELESIEKNLEKISKYKNTTIKI